MFRSSLPVFHRRCVSLVIALLISSAAFGEDSVRLVRADHYVRVTSTAPAFSGQEAQLYVREVALAGTVFRGRSAAERVVLFVHGSGTPGEVAFDVPYKDYSWMAFLAQAGFDVFAMDTTGYGRSTRPPAMSDPCNVPKAQQAQFVPKLIPEPCAPSHPTLMMTLDSDWNDIDAVVNYLRKLRDVERVSLVAWSRGGPRAGGYAARNPSKVHRLVALAPQYIRDSPTEAPTPLPRSDGPMTAQSHADFTSGWDREVACVDQYDQGASDAVWSEMLVSDPVGATWGSGVRRAPSGNGTVWGFNKTIVAKMQMPFLVVAGANDKTVPPERVRNLYADLGSKQKVFIDLACSSHNAMWEKNHLLLFQASLEWLRDGKASGRSVGMLKLGY